MHILVACHDSHSDPQMSHPRSKPVLTATGIVAGYRPDLPILHGVSVQIAEQEIVTIIGPNGAGKSTLIKVISGLVPLSQGTIQLSDNDITRVEPHRLAAMGVGYVPQTANVFTTLSIQENLVMGAMGLERARALERIETIYELYPELANRRQEKAGILSGGQRQMLAVARALLPEPQLMLLDEPTAGLSPKAAEELFANILNLVGNGVSILMVEQNAKAALRISDYAYVLAEGQNRFEGNAKTLLDSEEIGEIFLGVRRQTAS